jgi:hypothetical protein
MDSEAQVMDFEEAGAVLSAGSTKAALDAVAKQRAKDDDREGYFRDYPDQTPDSFSLYRPDMEMELLATRGKRPWIAQVVNATALLSGVVFTRDREEMLRPALVRLGALVVAWIEAIDRRGQEKLMMRPRPFWQRVVERLAWWRR